MPTYFVLNQIEISMDVHELNIKPQNIKNHCCTCLNELGSNKHEVLELEPTLLQAFRHCTCYIHLENEAYPNCLCAKCFDKLTAIVDFQEMSKKSMQYLEEILNTFAKAQNSKQITEDKTDECRENEIEAQNVDPLNEDERFEQVMVKPELNIFDEIPAQKDDLLELQDVNESNEAKESTLREGVAKSRKSHKTQLIECKFGCGKRFRRTLTAEKHYKECPVQPTDAQPKPEAIVVEATTIKSKINEKLKELGCSARVSTNAEIEPDPELSKKTCPICLKVFASASIKRGHLRTHLDERPFKCDQCDRGFNKRALLNAHCQEEHSEAPLEIPCKFGCGRVFKRHATATNHYRIKHILPAKGIQPASHPRICEECGKLFKNVTLLKEHSFVHLPPEARPFKCDQCGKRFILKKRLAEHILRHEGIKNFECNICGLKKTTRKELYNHMNYHTKARKYPCRICSKIFYSTANMKRHDEVVHQGLKKYSCRFCEESFGKPDTLKHHEMRHTGERPHKCEICNHAFIQVVALRAHMKTHNKQAKLTEQTQNIVESESNNFI